MVVNTQRNGVHRSGKIDLRKNAFAENKAMRVICGIAEGSHHVTTIVGCQGKAAAVSENIIRIELRKGPAVKPHRMGNRVGAKERAGKLSAVIQAGNVGGGSARKI